MNFRDDWDAMRIAAGVGLLVLGIVIVRVATLSDVRKAVAKGL